MQRIYYLLQGGCYSAWHRVLDADEVWCFHGGVLDLEMGQTQEGLTTHRLGCDVLQASVLSLLCPEGIGSGQRV